MIKREDLDLNRKLLVTFDNWFLAPDGESYLGAWGSVKICKAEELLGLKPSQSANWYAIIGDNPETSLIVAGCRIHYAVVCPNKPKDLKGKFIEKLSKRKVKRARIYITE